MRKLFYLSITFFALWVAACGEAPQDEGKEETENLTKLKLSVKPKGGSGIPEFVCSIYGDPTTDKNIKSISSDELVIEVSRNIRGASPSFKIELNDGKEYEANFFIMKNSEYAKLNGDKAIVSKKVGNRSVLLYPK